MPKNQSKLIPLLVSRLREEETLYLLRFLESDAPLQVQTTNCAKPKYSHCLNYVFSRHEAKAILPV